MKGSLTRAGGLLVLLGGIASLASFVFLPFGVNPLMFVPNNGIQLLHVYAQQVSSASNLYGNGQTDHHIYDPVLLSYGSLWVILLLFVLLTLLACFLVIIRKPHIVLPIACLVLSLLAIPGLFLAFYQFTTDTPTHGSFLQQMFTSDFPIVRFGWWVSLAGLLLTLVASLLVIIGRSLTPRS